MTGAKMSWRYFENSFDDLRCNPVLIDLMAKNLKDLGYDDFTTEEAVPSAAPTWAMWPGYAPHATFLSMRATPTEATAMRKPS